jgi:hypothetical protein
MHLCLLRRSVLAQPPCAIYAVRNKIINKVRVCTPLLARMLICVYLKTSFSVDHLATLAPNAIIKATVYIEGHHQPPPAHGTHTCACLCVAITGVKKKKKDD